MRSTSLAQTLSRFNSMEPDVWDYREDLQNLAAYLAEGGELDEPDALIQAVAGIDTYRGDTTIQTWLHRVISKECRVVGGRELSDDIDLHLDRAMGGHAHPVPQRGSSLKDELSTRRRMLDGFAALPHNYRAALLLKEGHGLTVEATAEMMGTTPAAVRSVLYRARSLWRQAAD